MSGLVVDFRLNLDLTQYSDNPMSRFDMNKAELSMLLEQKVQEKIREGYSITTYALDAASRDRVKRSLMPQSHQIEHCDAASEEWQQYLSKVEAGVYEPESPRPVIVIASSENQTSEPTQTTTTNVGQWKARRH